MRRMKTWLLACAVALLAGSLRMAAQPQAAPQSQATDITFRGLIDAKNIGEYMRLMAARPHHLGSPYGKQNAEWILARFTEWGWDARIESYDVLFPTPKERVLELLGPTPFKASLEEPAVAADPTSSQKSEQLPSFNAYSVDGDVTGPLVYVNYGRPSDYEELARRGISVKGAIVIARYGQSWRGIKPKVAAEQGAIGCLIYSDPRDDGFYVDGVFPDGPMRNPDGVQRGSVMDMPTFPGDPLTPNIGATPSAKRLDIKAVTTLTKIPVLPISYGDAQPLLKALEGPGAPADWRGALPITYRMGPSTARVHLKLAFDWSLKRAYNVIARLPGSTYPDEWIIRGNHHDAWVNGAQDPGSGMSAELEEARALGELVKRGWRPKRTIVYAAWDGEEQGLLGSTEWVEDHEQELRDKAAVYINSDGNGRGFLGASGSHALEALVNSVARDVEDPETKESVWKRMQARAISTTPPGPRAEVRARADLRISALGSGSDYSPFLQHAGIPSLNLGFGGLDPSDGVYHSIYDDYYHFTKFLDTDFAYGRALAQTIGTLVIRLAESDVLAVPVHAPGRHRADLRPGIAGAAEGAAGRGSRAQPPDRRGRVRVGRRSTAAGAGAVHRGGAARAEFRAARKRRERADARRGPLQEGARRRPIDGDAGIGARRQPAADPERASADRSRRPAAAALVSPPALRPGLLHRIRGQDDARCSRGDRRKALRRGGG